MTREKIATAIVASLGPLMVIGSVVMSNIWMAIFGVVWFAIWVAIEAMVQRLGLRRKTW